MFLELEDIKKMRRNLGLTQKELSVKAKVSQSIIAKIESKKISPSYDIVKRIFESLTIEKEEKETVEKIMIKKIFYANSTDLIKKTVGVMISKNIPLNFNVDFFPLGKIRRTK